MWNMLNGLALYNLIFKSRKPEAKAFRKWVTSEVLPSIRKTGAYSIQDSIPFTQNSGHSLNVNFYDYTSLTRLYFLQYNHSNSIFQLIN